MLPIEVFRDGEAFPHTRAHISRAHACRPDLERVNHAALKDGVSAVKEILIKGLPKPVRTFRRHLRDAVRTSVFVVIDMFVMYAFFTFLKLQAGFFAQTQRKPDGEDVDNGKLQQA
ncbi:Uncharacterised protein [Neisseria lactamica]|uniref:Uncharacterized protein n=1 Tax=Neisseria lactamica TaxID=486 RepID=A0A378VLJ0_NEILA|nr:Uncharacterised protein [Neisseria lactamica]